MDDYALLRSRNFEQHGCTTFEPDRSQSRSEIISASPAFRRGAQSKTVGHDPFHEVERNVGTGSIGYVIEYRRKVALGCFGKNDRVFLHRSRDFARAA
jgi:hypothetical protein